MSRPICVIQVALDDWPSSARLPRELNAAGLTVIALCGAASPLRLTRHVAHVAIATSRTLAAELERLILEYEPIAVIASDEQSVRHLHDFAVQPSASERMRTVIRRSLGNPSGYSVATSKWATAELAERMNIAVPRQCRISSVDGAMAFVRKSGFPVILKRENTYGGIGCYVCRSERQLRHGYKSLCTTSWLHRRLRVIARSTSLTDISVLSREPLIIQQFHEGRLAFTAAVADGGRMVSGLTAVAEAVLPAPTGASTVVRAIDAPELLQATRTLIAATECSGFVGVDFIIDQSSRRPYLLEINPRLTPLCHLGRLLGTDLCAAFASCFAKPSDIGPMQRRPGIEMIALFPNEWMRDPNSPFLRSAYHDVPFDDPALIADAHRRLPIAKRSMIRLGLHVPLGAQTEHDPIEERDRNPMRFAWIRLGRRGDSGS